jgi:hypothetical protein
MAVTSLPLHPNVPSDGFLQAQQMSLLSTSDEGFFVMRKR